MSATSRRRASDRAAVPYWPRALTHQVTAAATASNGAVCTPMAVQNSPREPWAPISGSRLASRVASAIADTVALPQPGTVQAADSDAAAQDAASQVTVITSVPPPRTPSRTSGAAISVRRSGARLGPVTAHPPPAARVAERPVLGECQAWSVS